MTPESLQELQRILLTQQPKGAVGFATPDVGSITPMSPYEAIQAQRSQLSPDPVISKFQRLGRGIKGLLVPETNLDIALMGMTPVKTIKAAKGLLTTKPDTSYRIAHQARGREFEDAIQLDDLTKDISGKQAGYPKDFYTPIGQKIYASGPQFKGDEFGIANLQSYNVIKKAKGNPEKEVVIYRAVPRGIKNINEGDFVTLSPKYAELHAASGYGRKGDEAGIVIKQKVKVKDLIWDGNDVNEFGYFPTGK